MISDESSLDSRLGFIILGLLLVLIGRRICPWCRVNKAAGDLKINKGKKVNDESWMSGLKNYKGVFQVVDAYVQF